MPLRLIFMGTPDFAVPTLVEIVGRGHEVVAVYTRAAKPAGRGMEPKPSPVEREARRFGLPVLTPTTLRTPEALAAFQAHGADAAVVVAYGLILPKPILRSCRAGVAPPRSTAPSWRATARPASW
jgi:methionyl-tRNA formyltransferase